MEPVMCIFYSKGCFILSTACTAETERSCYEANRRKELINKNCPLMDIEKNVESARKCDISFFREITPSDIKCCDCNKNLCRLREVPELRSSISLLNKSHKFSDKEVKTLRDAIIRVLRYASVSLPNDVRLQYVST